MCAHISGAGCSLPSYSPALASSLGRTGHGRFRSCVATVIRKQWFDHIGRDCLGGRSRGHLVMDGEQTAAQYGQSATDDAVPPEPDLLALEQSTQSGTESDDHGPRGNAE
jgi:hypothetical protein